MLASLTPHFMGSCALTVQFWWAWWMNNLSGTLCHNWSSHWEALIKLPNNPRVFQSTTFLNHKMRDWCLNWAWQVPKIFILFSMLHTWKGRREAHDKLYALRYSQMQQSGLPSILLAFGYTDLYTMTVATKEFWIYERLMTGWYISFQVECPTHFLGGKSVGVPQANLGIWSEPSGFQLPATVLL